MKLPTILITDDFNHALCVEPQRISCVETSLTMAANNKQVYGLHIATKRGEVHTMRFIRPSRIQRYVLTLQQLREALNGTCAA